MPLGKGRPELVYAPGTVQTWTGLCSGAGQDRPGLVYDLGTGQVWTGLVYANGAGQAWTGLCPWGRTGLK